MKLSKLIRVLVGVLAVVAFVLMFTDQLTYTLKIGNSITPMKFDEVLFDVYEGDQLITKGAGASFVGYLLVLLAGLAVTASLFFNNRFVSFINILCGILLIAGGIIVMSVLSGFKSLNEDYCKLLELAGTFSVNAGPIIAGILGIVGGLGACVGAVLPLATPKKKSKKRK